MSVQRAYASTFKLKVQGDVKSEVKLKGKEGQVEILHSQIEVEAPRDRATGQSIGRRAWKPIKIRTEIFKDSPKVFQAACNNERVEKLVVDYWKTSPDEAKEVNHYSITLEGGSICSVSFEQPNAFNHVAGTDEQPTQMVFEVSFAKITVEHKLGKVVMSDTWEVAQA